MKDLDPILSTITFLVLELSKSPRFSEDREWRHLITHLHQLSGVQYLHLDELNSQILSALGAPCGLEEARRVLLPSLRTFHSWHNFDYKQYRDRLKTVLFWRNKQKARIHHLQVNYEYPLKQEWLKIALKMARAYRVHVHFSPIPPDSTDEFEVLYLECFI